MSRLCKYHGRACENPGWCKEHSPRKYEGDGHEERIDPERLTLGCVVRMKREGGPSHAFNDNVVLGIKVSYHSKRQVTEKVDHRHFDTLDAALKDARKDDYVFVILARPYMYCSNVFGSMPNWLMGCEKYEVMGNRIQDTHLVVVHSTGEYSTYMAKDLLHSWEVVVTGGTSESWAPKDGKVFRDLSEGGARESYKIHTAMAQGAYGRQGGETVTLYCDGVQVEQYVGNMGGKS